METPSSSSRRVTRSQTLASALSSTNSSNTNIPVSRKMEDSRQRNGKQQDRSALIDITNDSPIVGLATGNVETPSSWAAAKQKGSRVKTKTPGSGEALLRGQVKTLLQKVEEEAEISKFLSMELQGRPFPHLVNTNTTPMAVLAPTPANTPAICNLSDQPPLVVEEQCSVSEVVMNDGCEKNQLTRSLFLDFSEKSDQSECSSELTYEEENKRTKEEDDASVWSMQVNVSSLEEEEEEEEVDEEKEEEEEYYEDEEEDDSGLVDELCEGLNKISVGGPKFEGKHTRFIYNSDDELVGEEEEEDVASPNVVHLKGMPTPKGKHLRFPEEEEEE